MDSEVKPYDYEPLEDTRDLEEKPEEKPQEKPEENVKEDSEANLTENAEGKVEKDTEENQQAKTPKTSTVAVSRDRGHNLSNDETQTNLEDESDTGYFLLFEDPDKRSSRPRYMIRVLTLLPGEEGDPILCELHHTYISDTHQNSQPEGCQPYEALSYTWGDLTEKHDILISGKRLEVTLNLESALRHLRQMNTPRFLWVDAVCINQKSSKERSAQVLRMNLIYEQAQQVVVWLGEEEADSSRAMDILEQLGGRRDDMVRKDLDGRGLFYGLRLKDPKSVEAFTEGLRAPDFDALWSLLQERAWWHRMWIIQEIAYSQNAVLVCGHRIVDWATIDSLISRTDPAASESAIHGPFRNAFFLNDLRRTLLYSRNSFLSHVKKVLMPFGVRLRSLLEKYEYQECSDPRDKVFALLGLLGCPKSDNLQVDYDNSTSVVFTQATWDIIYDVCIGPTKCTPSLDIICWAYRSERRLPGLPSWVPDWSEKRRFRLFQFTYKERSPYAAGGDCELASVPPINTMGILTIEGVLWDEIRYVTDGISRFRTPLNKQELRDALQLWEPTGLEAMKYPTGEDILDAYWRTLLTDIQLGGKEIRSEYMSPYRKDIQLGGKRIGPEDMSSYREEFLAWSGRTNAGNGTGNPDNAVSQSDSVFENLFYFVFGWTTATTEKGYLALVPLLSKPGDTICVVPSVSVPLVLHPGQSSDSETTWELVGLSYVHGIMDGEVMRKLEKGEVNRVGVKVL